MNFVIPCNLKKYKLIDAFENLTEIDWRQTMTKISVGDIVYIYAGRPISSILYKCEVMKINLQECEIDDSKYLLGGSTNNYKRYMRLKLLKRYPKDVLGYEELLEHGLATVQGPSQIRDDVSNFIETFDKI